MEKDWLGHKRTRKDIKGQVRTEKDWLGRKTVMLKRRPCRLSVIFLLVHVP